MTTHGRGRMTQLLRATVAVLLLAAPPLQRGSSQALAANDPTIRDLQSVDDLRGSFERDVGQVRLVLLLSPT